MVDIIKLEMVDPDDYNEYVLVGFYATVKCQVKGLQFHCPQKNVLNERVHMSLSQSEGY